MSYLIALICPSLALIAVAVLVFLAIRNRNRARLIEDAPFCTVSELASERSKIEGSVVALEEVISSPVTRTECVYFRFLLEELKTRQVTDTHTVGNERRTTTRTEQYWDPVIDDVQLIQVGVKDKTGTAEVPLGEAELMLHNTDRQTSGSLHDGPEGFERMLKKRYNQSTKGWFSDKVMRFTETVLLEGDTLFVLGTPNIRRGRSPRFAKSKGNPLIVSDSEENDLVERYKRTARYCWIAVGVVVPVALLVSLFTASMVWFIKPKGGPIGGEGHVVQGGDPLTKTLAELKAADPFARSRAADQLARTEPDPARRAEVARELGALVNDGNPFARDAALRALKQWGTPENVPQLLALLEHTEPGVRAATMDALGNLKDRQAVAPIVKRLGEFFDRRPAHQALVAMGPVAEPEVVALLQGTNVELQVEACNILGKIGTSNSVPALQQASRATNPRVAQAAQGALEAIGQRR